MASIRFLGHASWELTDGGTTVLVDPWLTGNPKAAAEPGDLSADAVLLTHGHPDHYGDTIDIAKRTGAPVLAITELAGEIAGILGDDHAVHNPNYATALLSASNTWSADVATLSGSPLPKAPTTAPTVASK